MINGLFSPGSIAVAGASRDRRAVGRRILDALVEGPFEGPVYAINPAATHVGSVPAHPSLSAIGKPVDLVVVAVPAKLVHEVVAEAADVGAGHVVVVSAGFAESGDEGRAAQDELAALVAERGMRMVGPNCLGVLATDPEVNMNASFAPEMPPVGNFGLASQSGALGIAIIELARRLGLGLSNFVSLGNQADITVSDLIEFWGTDPATGAGLLYLESFTDPARFRQVATETSRQLPLVMVKSGTTSAGSRAASSHTAALAGSDTAVEALLEQSGVIRAASLEHMFGIARILCSQPRPKGRRAAVVTNSGGPGVLCVDALLRANYSVEPLSDEASAELARQLPAAASVGNPIDMLAAAGAAAYRDVTEAVLSLDEVDVLIVIYTPIGLEDDEAVAQAISDGVAAARAKGADGVVLASVVGGEGRHSEPQANGEAGGREVIPTFAFPEDLAPLLGPIGDYCDWLARDLGRVGEPKGCDTEEALRIVTEALSQRGEGWLTVAEARAVLDAVGINLNAGRVVVSAAEARAAADEIGYPVAVTVASTGIVHKSDVGGVHLNLATADEVAKAYQAVSSLTEGTDARLDGALVGAMEDGIELFLGVDRDASFGPLIGFGLGGTSVEVLDDVAFRLAPLTDRDAHDQVRSIRGWKLLAGHRGAPPVDAEAIEDLLARISALVVAVDGIAELDINPFFARPDGVVATDVRILIKEPGR